MNPFPGYFFGILSASAAFCLGRYLIAQPEKVARVFAFGQPPINPAITFFRIVGRLYCGLSVIAMVIFLVATVAAIFGR